MAKISERESTARPIHLRISLEILGSFCSCFCSVILSITLFAQVVHLARLLSRFVRYE